MRSEDTSTCSPITLGVRASLHSWRRHSSVSRPNAFFAASSLLPTASSLPPTSHQSMHVQTCIRCSPMTFAVRASLHSWRRHSSVSRPSAFFAASSSLPTASSLLPIIHQSMHVQISMQCSPMTFAVRTSLHSWRSQSSVSRPSAFFAASSWLPTASSLLPTSHQSMHVQACMQCSPMTFAVRASLHSWRRHSSVSRPSAFLAASSLCSPSVAKSTFCRARFSWSLHAFLLAFLISAHTTQSARLTLSWLQANHAPPASQTTHPAGPG